MNPLSYSGLVSYGLALLLGTAAPAAMAQTADALSSSSAMPAASSPGPSAELSGIEKDISEAEAELAQYDGGLIVAMIQARIETLKLTRAILINQVAAAEGGATTAITVPVGAPDPARAADILKEIETQTAVIREAEAEARGSSGLVGALALSRVHTEKLTLASLRAAWLAAEYGSILPVEIPASAAPSAPSQTSTAKTGTAAAAPAASDPALPEWADPDYPEIDYTKPIFAEVHAEGFSIHGWWGLQESRAEIDDSPQVIAVNFSAYPEGLSMTNPTLLASCREGEASLVYNADTYMAGNFMSDSMPTTYRIDNEPAQTNDWSKLANGMGSGLFGTRGEAMLRDLYDADKIFLRIEDQRRHDATFDLAGIQPVAEAIAKACSFSLLDLSPDDYRAIQTMLNAAGFDAGTPDGVWGKGSADAMRQWQEKNGLSATGAPDRATLEAMGLGSGQG